MCYIQPLSHDAQEFTSREEHYNLLRYRLFQGWWELLQREEYSVLKDMKLPDLLTRCFFAWEKVLRQLEEEGLLTQKDWELRDLVLQRAELWRVAEGDKVLREKETEGWRELWRVGRYGWLKYKGVEKWNPPISETDTKGESGGVVGSTVVIA